MSGKRQSQTYPETHHSSVNSRELTCQLLPIWAGGDFVYSKRSQQSIISHLALPPPPLSKSIFVPISSKRQAAIILL